MSGRSSTTIRDVAAQVVFLQTVSHLISKHVLPETRQRVEDAIRALGFRPNAIARSMAAGRTHTLACLSPNLTDYTFASLIEGAEVEARQSGYFLLSASAPDADTFATLVEQLVESRRTEGLVVINPYIDLRYTFLPENFPTVFLGARPRGEKVSSVYLDEDAAARSATNHLLSLGHTHISHICGPMNEDCSQDRLQGYQTALKYAGIPYEPALVVEELVRYIRVSGCANRDKSNTLFTQHLHKTIMAAGAIRPRECGLQVPDDVFIL
jgi:DNA-binding LacI/PurR family transcriptional regulator